VPPDVLVHADDTDTVKATRIIDEQTLAFGQDGGVGGVPGQLRIPGNRQDGSVIHHQGV
jgi:hypothetical protein